MDGMAVVANVGGCGLRMGVVVKVCRRITEEIRKRADDTYAWVDVLLPCICLLPAVCSRCLNAETCSPRSDYSLTKAFSVSDLFVDCWSMQVQANRKRERLEAGRYLAGMEVARRHVTRTAPLQRAQAPDIIEVIVFTRGTATSP